MSTGQTYLGKFMKVFVKKFVSLTFCQKWRIKKKKKNSIVAIELPKLEE